MRCKEDVKGAGGRIGTSGNLDIAISENRASPRRRGEKLTLRNFGGRGELKKVPECEDKRKCFFGELFVWRLIIQHVSGFHVQPVGSVIEKGQITCLSRGLCLF